MESPGVTAESEEPELILAVADQQIFGLLVKVQHHLMVLAADAGFLVAAEGRAPDTRDNSWSTRGPP